MKRMLWIGVLGIWLGALGIGGAFAAPEADTLAFSWSSNVGPLNPHMYSPNQMFAQAMVYETLVRYGNGGTIEPCLAERWEISEDGKTYTFFLRRSVVFSDGAPWDAAAAKKNFDALLANAPRHSWLALIPKIDAVEAVDSHTLRLTLKTPYYPTLYDLCAMRPVRFLSPKAFPESGNTAEGIGAPVGTGPWILAETKKGEYDLFVRNDTYWGSKPAFAKVLVRVIPESETRVVALETGEIDLIFVAAGSNSAQITNEAFKRLEASGRFVALVSPPVSTQSIALNSARGATADLAVRRAIQHAVDKDVLVRAVFLDMEHRADFLFNPAVPYCNLNLIPYSHDLAQAEALLEEAGWKRVEGNPYRQKGGEVLATDLYFVGHDPLQKTVAEALQSDFRKMGMELRLVGEETDSFYKRQKDGTFGMIFNETWGAPYEPHTMVGSMVTPSHADYQAQAGLPMKKALDEKIAAVLRTTEEGPRQELYREILTTLHDQAVYLPLTYKTTIALHTKDVTGVIFSPLKGYVPFERMARP